MKEYDMKGVNKKVNDDHEINHYEAHSRKGKTSYQIDLQRAFIYM